MSTSLSSLPDPPGPQGHWFFGSALRFRADPLVLIEECRKAYGNVLMLRMLAGMRAYVLLMPEHVEHVLKTGSDNYPKGAYFNSRAGTLFRQSLLTNEGELWKRQRRVAAPRFSPKQILDLVDPMVKGALTTAERWSGLARGGEPVDMLEEMTRLTLKIAGEALFGTDISERTPELHQSLHITFDFLYHRLRTLLSLPPSVPTRRNRQYYLHEARLRAVTEEVIQKRRALSDWPDDLLTALMRARYETGEPMPDSLLHDEVMTLFVTGHESTTAVLTWAWYLLGTHRDIEERLHEELDTVLGGRPPTAADLKSLPFARQIVDEVLRLFPSVWGVGRVALADDEVGGYRVRGGSRVLLSTYVTQRHPDYWERPHAFFPDHFLPDRVAARPKFAYYPFGGGSRQCLGNHFAAMEAQLVLATLAQQFLVRPRVGDPVAIQMSFTMRPASGLRMFLIPRQPSDRRALAPPVRLEEAPSMADKPVPTPAVPTASALPPSALPPQARMFELIAGKWISMSLSTAARLGIADQLAAGPKSTMALAKTAGCEVDSLYRLLRALSAVGVFAETEPRHFSLTPLSECLRSDVPGSMRDWAILSGGELHWRLWGELAQSVRTGKSATVDVFGQDYFEYLRAHPEMNAVFDRSMVNISARPSAALPTVVDFTRFRRVVDIGGGQGLLLTALLRATPGLVGTLFDQPEVVARAKPALEAAGVADRCECVGGSFFQEVPSGGDAYLLKSILHDWTDEVALDILQRCRQAMAPEARLLIIEVVMGAPNTSPLAGFLDLAMLVMLDGRERTEEEFRALLARAGFRLDRVVPITTPGPCVLEAVPV